MTFARRAQRFASLVVWMSLSPAVSACGSSEPAGSPGGGDASGLDSTMSADTGGGEGSSSGDTGTSADSSGSTDSASPTDGGGVPDAACVPGCPAGIQCGRYTDCAGNTLICGQPCMKGQACVVGLTAQTCQPTATACTGKCGIIGVDACGIAIGCGGCPAGDDCVNNACVPQAPSDGGKSCGTLACSGQGQTFCGTITDGCGHTKQCNCSMGQACIAGLCQPPPPECIAGDGGGSTCGNHPNACGSGNVQCGGCTGAGTTCMNGACVACTLPVCNGATCGSVSNACGRVTCGMCSSGERCYDGGCCQPLTCADFPDAGCDPVNEGCGKQEVCYNCPASDFCQANACVLCHPKTCTDFGNMGCGHSDGCGKTLDCCPLETTCQQGLCCPTGQVNYQGSCCQPQCDATQPPGPQLSCGQIILCSN
jgi:hypothetical protein